MGMANALICYKYLEWKIRRSETNWQKCDSLYLYLFPDIERFIATQDQTLTVTQGDAIIISLPSIDSVPDPEIKWFEGTTEIIGQERAYKSLRNDLIILESRFSNNNDVYMARAIDRILREKRDTPKYTLLVQSKYYHDCCHILEKYYRSYFKKLSRS
jgi:hypothetical protein